MRVAVVCPYSLSSPGGVQGQVLGLARAWRAEGHVAVVVGPADGPPPDVGVRTVGRTVALSANGSIAPIALGPGVRRRTIEILATEQPDVVHLHEPLVPGPTLTSLLAHRAPTVGTFHRSGPSRAYRALAPLVRRAASRLDARVAVSEDAEATAASVLGGEYRLLANAIELAPLSKAVPWPTQRTTVLFLGRHEPRKGLQVLLEAWKGLEEEADLWVAGTGPETAALRQRYSDLRGVVWLGRLSDEEKAGRLRGADIVCVPSLHGESFGVVLLEAMAAEAAVVASDLPGYRRVVETERNGLLVPPGDPSALRGALRRLLRAPDLREELVIAAADRVGAYDMAHLARQYLALFTTLL
jgi:phosphatidylinositol alpha-mannosyltransferase